MEPLPPADRFSDERDDNPAWNESVWFSFSQPQRRLHGFVQYYFRPNLGLLNGGPVMWDPSGTQPWNCLYYHWSQLQAMPPGAQKFDMRAPNSLAVKVLEPLQRYAIRYDREGFSMDLQWEAIAPLHELKTGRVSQQRANRFHIEQPGRLRGHVRRDGASYDIDCYSMRDTSWGPRENGAVGNGSYFWGIRDDRAFHAISSGEGAEQRIVGGFIWQDGELASLVCGHRRVIEYGRLGPRRVEVAATDQRGRQILVQGQVDEGLVFTGYTDRTVVWSLTEWDWAGTRLWGDTQEFCRSARFRRIARGELAITDPEPAAEAKS